MYEAQLVVEAQHADAAEEVALQQFVAHAVGHGEMFRGPVGGMIIVFHICLSLT